MGKGMMIAAWIVFLGLLAFFFKNILDKQHNPNQEINSSVLNSGIRVVRLVRNRNGHYVSRGYINNQEVTFFLDTGATTISIPEPVARKIGLKRGPPISVSTANGSIEVYLTTIRRLSIGSIVLDNLSATINPYMEGDDILLGMNVLKKLEIIQKGKILTLKQYP
ncbi:MAG TPA: TIGR02281 family clan AA aspartic protease [Gammaproteobacteria bacterium]|nr:TIGR02281 family clan AA aspartic protease [Gammaproteobacteria bacterium]